jgi:hypothetical protein
MLLFKRHFLALIRSGRKRQTIRLWKSPRVRVGQAAFAPGLGRILITAVETLASLTALTRADARADGFATRKALLEEIHRLYDPLPKDRRIFRIRFQYPVGGDPPHVPARLPADANVTKRKRAVKSPKPKIENRKSHVSLPQQRQTLRHFLVGLARRVEAR